MKKTANCQDSVAALLACITNFKKKFNFISSPTHLPSRLARPDNTQLVKSHCTPRSTNSDNASRLVEPERENRNPSAQLHESFYQAEFVVAKLVAEVTKRDQVGNELHTCHRGEMLP